MKISLEPQAACAIVLGVMNNLDRQLAKDAIVASKVAARVKARILKRQPCCVCGDEPAEAHHNDYSKPLDVQWLCKAHHTKHHWPQKPEDPIIPPDEMPDPELMTAMMRLLGRKGGKAGKGLVKTRSNEQYRKMAQKRWAKA